MISYKAAAISGIIASLSFLPFLLHDFGVTPPEYRLERVDVTIAMLPVASFFLSCLCMFICYFINCLSQKLYRYEGDRFSLMWLSKVLFILLSSLFSVLFFGLLGSPPGSSILYGHSLSKNFSVALQEIEISRYRILFCFITGSTFFLFLTRHKKD